MSIYFDNAATSWPKPIAVPAAMSRYLEEMGASPSRSSYRRAVQVEEVVFETRQMLADLINGQYPSQLIFTPNATVALNLGILGLIQAGDHVITTTVEHNSVIRPLYSLQQAGQIEVTWVSCDEQGLVDVEEIEKSMRPNTRLIVLNHASNVTGMVQPAAEVGRIARQAGVAFLLDASQTIGHLPIDLEAWHVDLLACPGHKGLYGPPGTGALYINPRLDLKPLFLGGTGILSEVLVQPEAMPVKYESGTLNTVGIFGLHAGLSFVKETGMDAIRTHEAELRSTLYNALADLGYVKLFGPADADAAIGTLSFTIDGFLPGRVGFLLDEYFDIQVRAGLHCSPMIHACIGTDLYGTVRVSFSHFNTLAEVDRLLEAIRKIGMNRPAQGLRIPVRAVQSKGDVVHGNEPQF